MRVRYGIGILSAVIALSLAVSALYSIRLFTLRLPENGNALYYASRVHRGDEVRIRYMHSVEKSPVEGRFEIAEDRQLEAVETRMKSVGTGLPNTESDRTKIEDSWIVVDEGRKKLDEIRFFYSPAETEMSISVKGNDIPLKDIPPGGIMVLAVERTSLLRWVLGGVLGGNTI